MIEPIFALAGAALYRIRGQDEHPDDPWWYDRPWPQLALSLPLGVIGGIAADRILFHFFDFSPQEVGASLVIIAFALCWAAGFVGLVSGHGRGLDLGERDDGEPEKIERFMALFKLKQRVKLYWYDFLILTFTGLAVTLLPALLTLSPTLALAGACKGACYALPKKLRIPNYTEVGEFLFGAVLWYAVWDWLI